MTVLWRGRVDTRWQHERHSFGDFLTISWESWRRNSHLPFCRQSVSRKIVIFLECNSENKWFLVIVQLDLQIPFNIFIYSSLHISSTSCSSSGETDCINTASGKCHSVLVAVSCAGWMSQILFNVFIYL